MPPAFIYFDLGNVVCFFDRPQQVRQVAELTGVAEEKVADLLLAPDGLLWKCERGELTDEQFHEEYSRATGTTSNLRAFLKANSDIFTLNTTLLPLLAHLEDTQVPLGLLSNISSAHWRHVSGGRFEILATAFRIHVLSYEVGAMKPDETIFRGAIELAQAPPDKILYIDDMTQHVEAGRRIGLDAVQYTTTDALSLELINRGVRCNY